MTASARRQLWVGAALWLALIGAGVGWAASAVWSLHERSARELASVEPRYARLVGLGADRARLQEAMAQARQEIERHAYPAARDASQAANDAQQRVRDAFSRAGLDVISIQVLPTKPTKHFDRIPIALRVDGELATVQATLAALPTLAPSLFVEGLTLQTSTVGEYAPVRVVAELQLFALRLRP